MALLTAKEAARLLREGLGWPVRASDVNVAVEKGRLRGEKGPGRHDYLIPEEEVLRILEEHRQEAGDASRSRADQLEAEMWDAVPRRSADLLWRVRWKRKPDDWGS